MFVRYVRVNAVGCWLSAKTGRPIGGVLKHWKRPCMKKKTAKKSKLSASAALKLESERALAEQIRRLLALPMNKRTHFLRVRRPGGGSHL
jgi:hypothetical protein